MLLWSLPGRPSGRPVLPPNVTLVILDDLKLLPWWTAGANPVRSSSDAGPVTLSHCRAPLVWNSTRHCTAWPLQRERASQRNRCLRSFTSPLVKAAVLKLPSLESSKHVCTPATNGIHMKLYKSGQIAAF